MNSPHFILILTTVLFAAGCSRQSMHDAKIRREFNIPADVPIRDLGTVELSVNIPKVVGLGVGKELTLTAFGMTNNMLQVSKAYKYEHKPDVWEMPASFGPVTNMYKPDEESVSVYHTYPEDSVAVVMRLKLVSR